MGAFATPPVMRGISPSDLGDLPARFCGITMCCITTGVIWVVIKPESLISFMLAN